MKVSVLLENNIDKQSQLKDRLLAAHGLSLYIEWNGKKILFDTGPDLSFARNAVLMGIDLEQVDLVIISHGHNDHSGGLEEFFQLNSSASVYMHKEAPLPHYSRKETGNIVPIGIDASVLVKYRNRIKYINKTQDLLPGLRIYENIPQDFPRPMTNGNLYRQVDRQMIPDDFRHEILMSLDEGQRTSIITGCSHSGILNMVNLVKKDKPEQNVQAVFGGFHVYSRGQKSIVSPTYIEKLTSGLKELDTQIFTGHCTGLENFNHIKEELGETLHSMNTGLIIQI